MFYLDITIRFLAKMILQAVPFTIGLFVLLISITRLKNDSSWLKRALNKVWIRMS